MDVERKIKELEDRQESLKIEMLDIINQPINDNSIADAQTRGVNILSESVNNTILIKLLKMGDNTKI